MATPAGDSPEQEQDLEQHSAPSEHQMPQHRASMSTPNTTPTAGSGGLKMVAGYALERRLGSGSFATVYRGVKVLDSTGRTEFSAIKAISRSSEKLTKKVLENLELEISILRTYRHPNIVCLYDVQKTERHVYLILEYCAGGDVQQLIRSRKTGRLSERLTRRLIRDLTAGLKFLWGQELIHRDIKPQNLLLSGPLPLDEVNDPAKKSTDEDERMRVDFPSAQFSLKIADFGFARHLQTTSLAETLCGSPLYMAPEILQHQRYAHPSIFLRNIYFSQCWERMFPLSSQFSCRQPIPKTHKQYMYCLISTLFSIKLRQVRCQSGPLECGDRAV